ncbi:MAG: glycoside hydrolase family protein [Paraclostridium sp.]
MIKLIKNYPYDNNYDYIKLHSSKVAQQNYFNAFSKILIDEGEEEGYIREGESFIVEYNYDYLVNEGVNYVIWNNGYKDLYCFIVKKEYVDEELTRLHYEIDVLNTYLFDIKINNSFVERKKCTLDEICDYDEGLEIGEHIIEDEVISAEKTYKYFAMFNGIKEQQLLFDTNGNITNVVSLPSPTLKPTTIIDGIPYPIYFMELKEEYEEPIIFDIEIPSGGIPGGSGNEGTFTEGKISREGFRFIKGYEGYAPRQYQDSSGYWTICYGVTLHGEPDIYNELRYQQPVDESVGAKISYDLKNTRYASKIKDRCVELGITKQYQFDALVSLAYNCGYGVITGSNSLTNAIKANPLDEATIRPIWEKFYVTSNGTLLNGLVARRKQECNMFFNRPYEVRKITLINSDGSYNGYVTSNNGDGWLPTNTTGGVEYEC